MTGAKKRQHHIPRMLLRRFASRTDGEKSWVWQISRVGEPVEISTRDAAVGAWFYGRHGNGLEDALMRSEDRFADVLKQIDAGASPESLEDELSWLVYLLAVRTRALRGHAADATHEVLRLLEESVTIDRVRDGLRDSVARDFDKLVDGAISEMPAHLQPMMRALALDPAFRESLKRGLLSDDSCNTGVGFMKHVLQSARANGRVEDALGDGQNRGLRGLVDRGAVPSTFRPDSWRIVSRAGGGLVLGDACLVARDPEGNVGIPARFGDEWSELFVPLASDSLLVATKGRETTVPDTATLNLWSAQVSRDFIFTSSDDSSARLLASSIGTGDAITSREDILSLPEHAWGELFDDDDADA